MKIQKYLDLLKKYEQAEGQIDQDFREALVKAANEAAQLKQLLVATEKFGDDQTFEAVANEMYENRKPA